MKEIPKSPAEHKGKRPYSDVGIDCTAVFCYCKWIKFHIYTENAKLKMPKESYGKSVD